MQKLALTLHSRTVLPFIAYEWVSERPPLFFHYTVDTLHKLFVAAQLRIDANSRAAYACNLTTYIKPSYHKHYPSRCRQQVPVIPRCPSTMHFANGTNTRCANLNFTGNIFEMLISKFDFHDLLDCTVRCEGVCI
uniref:Bm12949 n=1 Tax=Brugia malayi TaxID=6279 RepID=A0A1I9G3S0_BRUMA|nr:Bm12949 [Brugia malayi]